MRILPLLKCIGKALLKGAARAVGADIVGEMAVEVAQEVWTDWNKTQDEAERRAELQAVVQMAAGEFREQIEAVVREMAADQPETVQEQLSTCLQQLPELARASFRRPEDQKGQSVPRHFQLMQPKDLVPFVSFRVTRVPPRPRVTLAFSKGVHTGQDMVCTEPTVLVIGKAKDCNPRYPKQDHEQVSRHHCLVEINPPDVVIQDMGSLNGTFVNNDLLGKRPREPHRSQANLRRRARSRMAIPFG